MAAYVPRISSGISGCCQVRPLTCASYMTLSAYCRFGGRSTPQSKNGLITTDLGMCAAESSSLRLSRSPKL